MVYTKLVICEAMRGASDGEVGVIMPEVLELAGCTHLWPFPPEYSKASLYKQKESSDECPENALAAVYSNVVAASRFYEHEDRRRTSGPDDTFKRCWGVTMQRVVEAALPLLRRATHLIKAVWKSITSMRESTHCCVTLKSVRC